MHGNPLVVGAYPFIGVGSLILAFPFLMFLAFSKEFNRLNPLLPQDYWFLLNRALTAANRGNMKVTSKEL